MHLAQFLVVGATGVIVNLAVLTLCQKHGASPAVAIASGICVSVISNFALNRRFSFSYARDRSWTHQFLGFVIASGVGAAVNFPVALYLQSRVLAPTMPHSLQIAALAGVIAGMAFNFIANRYFVFRKRFIRTKKYSHHLAFQIKPIRRGGCNLGEENGANLSLLRIYQLKSQPKTVAKLPGR
jgi:dolichol-phosphate mannosyltransferase